MIDLQGQAGNYNNIIVNSKELYIRDMLEYFRFSWEYNSRLKEYMPSFTLKFLSKYFNQSELEINNNVENIMSCNSIEESLGELSSKLRYRIQKGLLGEAQSYRLPDIQQPHMLETIELVANLFAEGKIKSFRFGADLRITNTGVSRQLTLEIVTNRDGILKYECGLLKQANHAVLRENILEGVNKRKKQ